LYLFNRIRLHIFTNLTLSSRLKEELQGEVAGIPLERHIWDLQRLSAIYQSSREREAVEIDLEELGGTGIPCLEAAHADDLSSYLCVIKGDQLADLFDRYGSRLLEDSIAPDQQHRDHQRIQHEMHPMPGAPHAFPSRQCKNPRLVGRGFLA